MADKVLTVFKGKKIVAGICGGIAAYKAADVVSKLRQLGASVHVIMTENAQKFVMPLTFQTLSSNRVITDMFEEPDEWNVAHVSLSASADLVLVLPATANIIGKVASGIADDMLTTTIMAAHCKVAFVPAMNTAMYENPVVQRNIEKLSSLNYSFIEPGTGMLACGTEGKGRMPDTPDILNFAAKLLDTGSITKNGALKGKTLLLTAGPTQESIDPVRFISNHSSGKMGYAIARAALEKGAKVILITGPVGICAPEGAEIIPVKTALEMYEQTINNINRSDIAVFTAAVADYRVDTPQGHKIKKTDNELVLRLVKNPDIAYEAGKTKGKRVHVCFCAETENLIENAVKKLKTKNCDLVVANDVTMEGAGFGTDTNKVSIVTQNFVKELALKDKYLLAFEILDELEAFL